MTTSGDPLTRLVDDGEVNRELLAKVLEHQVSLDLRNGAFPFSRSRRDGLSARSLVVIALLAQQALHLLDGRHAAGLAPRKIEELSGVGGGTLRPILMRLSDQSLARKNDETGEYTIPG